MKLAIINMAIFAVPYFVFPREIMTILGGVFQGAGDTLPPMVASIVANMVLKLPLAYLFSIVFNMRSNGVWLTISLSEVIEALIIIFYYKKDRWKEKVI